MFNHLRDSKYSFLLNCFPRFEYRAYIDCSSIVGRSTIAKLLCSMHHMEIETGRWSNIDSRIRFCTYCMQNRMVVCEIGDEINYILFCPQFDQARRVCSSKLNAAGTNINFIDIISGNFVFDTSIYYKFAVVSTFVQSVLVSIKLVHRSSSSAAIE